MSEKKFSYLNRDFDDYKSEIKNFIEEYYPQIAADFDDASVGSWLVDLMAGIGDNLSFYIDKTYSETNIDTAQQKSSVYAIARNNGFKVPGPRGSIAEVEFTCELPLIADNANSDSQVGMPNWSVAPILKRGTKLASSTQFFEVMDDIDFSKPCNHDMVPNRTIIPKRDSNGRIVKYIVSKRDIVVAGESKIYRQVINPSDVKSFMEIVIPEKDIMSVESIIFKDGADYKTNPSMNEFMMQKEYLSAAESPSKNETYRFFEVNSLVDQYRWGDDIDNSEEGNQNYGRPVVEKYSFTDEKFDGELPLMYVTKGQWHPLTQKFITEYTDSGYLKITFGGGEAYGQNVDYSDAMENSKRQISKMIYNDFLGKVPKAGWTMYIMYRIGGGAASNVSKGAINNIVLYNLEIGSNCYSKDDYRLLNEVKNSLRVTNTTPSVSGKDAPSVDEIRAMVKYNNAAQERCVTLKDYENRVMLMPSRYGVPFRVRAVEENNKVMLYLMGIDSDGKLSTEIPLQMAKNLANYLSMYRSINDYVEMKAARIVNVSFEGTIYVDKNYNAGDVVKNVIKTIKDYMDINKRQLGEDIFVGDLEKEISKVDGVINLIDLTIYNEHDSTRYSSIQTSQEIIEEDMTAGRSKINLEASDYILNSEPDEMFEVKYPERDIKIYVKAR